MSTIESKRVTSVFLMEQARRIAADARQVSGIEDEPVRAAVRVMYDAAKLISDARAREIAANSRPPIDEKRHGVPTNVGDPLKGASIKRGK
jgi:hypothetical protein